jgi:HEAT repeat protein
MLNVVVGTAIGFLICAGAYCWANSVYALRRKLYSSVPRKSEMAVRKLLKKGGPEAAAALCDAVVHHTDNSTRCRIAAALGKLTDPQVVPVLTESLKDHDANLRKVVAETLGVP